jgi:hypothetical protein
MTTQLNRSTTVQPLTEAPRALAPMAHKINEVAAVADRALQLRGQAPVQVIAGDTDTVITISIPELTELVATIVQQVTFGGGGGGGGSGGGGGGGAAGELGPPTNSDGTAFGGALGNLTLGLRALRICENGVEKTIFVVGTVSI